MKPAAVLDIGSSKIVCMCGSSSNSGGTILHGVGVSEYSGYTDGQIVDASEFEGAIVSAIREAEETSRSRIRNIVLSVPAAFSKLLVTDAEIRMESQKEQITSSHIDQLIAISVSKAQVSDYILMHSTPISFKVNGKETSEVPEGKMANDVSIKVSHMYVNQAFLEKVTNILHDLSVEVSMCVSAQLAESVFIVPEEERIRPAVLIDVGYHQTDISVIENGALKSMTSFNIGGFHFANDLAYGLDSPIENCETLKRKFSFLPKFSDEMVTLYTLTGIKSYPQTLIDMIMHARADELADMISKSLLSMRIRTDLKPAIYITGGGFCMMTGACEYLRNALNMNIRMDMPYIPDMDSPNYSSAFGTLDFVLQAANHGDAMPDDFDSEGGTKNRLLNKVKDIFVS